MEEHVRKPNNLIIRLRKTGHIIGTLFLITGVFLVGYLIGPLRSLSTAPLPIVENVSFRGYVRPNGNLVIEESISFFTPLVGNNFTWNVPIELNHAPTVILDNGEKISARLSKANNSANIVSLKTDTASTTFRLQYTLTNATTPTNNKASLRWQLVSQPTITINRMFVTLSLPHSVPQESISTRLFTTNNIVSKTTSTQDEQTITARMETIGPQASAAMLVEWPKTGLQTSFANRFASELTATNVTGLLITAVALPILAFIALIGMLIEHYFNERIPRIRNKRSEPPTVLSPAVLSTLVHKEVSHGALLASFFDLASRGYIDIFERDGKFTFGRRKPNDAHLVPWEQNLLDQIFQGNQVTVEKNILERTVTSRLFSPKIVTLYESVYTHVTNLGYFKNNPHLIRTRYKMIGLVFYFMSIGSMIYVIATNQPSVLILLVTSLLLTSFVILRLARLMPVRSESGKEALVAWLEFKSFLKDSQPLDVTNSLSNMFFAYLPYAMVFGIEKEWAKRFRRQAVLQPSWYVSYDNRSTEPFTTRFIKTVDSVSKTFVSLHGPIVE